ncbi:MAG TPA: hypothetical protein VKV15_15350 [Bryobacteraceae bacterium]|nr:hypothetical protein [Bryobacteraceae bacterium]
MSDRSQFFSNLLAGAGLLSLVLALPRFASAQVSPAPATKTHTVSKGWTAPRTPDGQPDLQGYWTNLSFTPLERPAEYGNREFLTEEESAKLFKQGIQHSYEFTYDNPAGTPVYDATTFGLGAWQNGVKPNKRTSLIVDPPDGRIPPLTPEAQKAKASRVVKTRVESPEDLTLGVRCLTFGRPPLLPAAYNSNYYIVQIPGYVMIEAEWNSEARMIPLDGRPHLSGNIHRWHGDSRGHWEGDTLVVETTNFKPGATPMNANPATLRILERFKRVDADTIEYKFTIDDPSTWTRPWTAIIPMNRAEGPLFEYACSEGNNDLINMLEAGRAGEKPGGQGKQ